MAEHRRQHYLSQFYLRTFSREFIEPRRGRGEFPIWRYDLEKKDVKLKSPQNVAFEPYFYSYVDEDGKVNHEIEKSFAEFESTASSTLERLDEIVLRSRKRLPCQLLADNERRTVLEFALLTFKRSPMTMKMLHEEVHAAIKEVSAKFNQPFDGNLVRAETLNLMISLGGDEELNFLMALLRKNSHLFYLQNEDASFVTTDNPLVRWNVIPSLGGFGISNTEIYFPISQRCLLFLYGIGNKHSISRLSDRKFLRKFNTFMARQAIKIIVTRDREYLVRLLMELNYQVKEGR